MIEVIQTGENVYILKDSAGCCANLVTGREQALLFDTGSGIDDLNAAVRTITPLPLVVINSHGHFDHIGGNRQFEQVYMHKDDFSILESYTPDLLARWRKELIMGREEDCREEDCRESGCQENGGQESGGQESGCQESGCRENGCQESGCRENGGQESGGQESSCQDTGCRDTGCRISPALTPLSGPWENIKPLDFHTLDLGDMECRIIPLKGHTAGSVGIWIPKLKLLLSGDALTPVMCLIFENHMSVEDQYKTLKYVRDIKFDYYLTSHHGKAFSRAMIDRLMRCIENSRHGKWHLYQYPSPPYAKGKIYLDSLMEEPVALIC